MSNVKNSEYFREKYRSRNLFLRKVAGMSLYSRLWQFHSLSNIVFCVIMELNAVILITFFTKKCVSMSKNGHIKILGVLYINCRVYDLGQSIQEWTK